MNIPDFTDTLPMGAMKRMILFRCNVCGYEALFEIIGFTGIPTKCNKCHVGGMERTGEISEEI